MTKSKAVVAVLDPFIMTLLGAVVLATILPCNGSGATLFEFLTHAAIVTLFFCHGAKLSRSAIVAGMLNVRLHLATLCITYVVFPLLGLAVIRLPLVDTALLSGILFLTLLPSTVQSSIAFTAIANGNVPAAVCAATLSNLLGMFVTPCLVALCMQTSVVEVQVSWQSIRSITFQLLLPFIVGHSMRPLLASWIDRNKFLLGRLDRGSILLVVYTAFSASVIDGLWSKVSIASLFVLAILCFVLLMLVFGMTWAIGRCLGLKRADAIVLFFCGSKKSLASGVPIASTLFPESQLGLVLLPVMMFHQLQLIACAYIARHLGDDKTATQAKAECNSR